MKAMGFLQHGNYEVLKELTLDDPRISDSNVLIKIDNTSVNTLDIMTRNGIPGFNFKMPHIPGSDIIGKIEEIGKNVNNFSVGEKVIVNTVYGCDNCYYCKSGEEQRCPSWKCLGLQVDGSYAELISVPSSSISKIPKGFSDEELASMPLHVPLAWKNIKKLAKAVEGETILIRGASGLVGIFAIQLSLALKLNVIALSGSPEKEQQLKKLGKITLISSKKTNEELIKEVMDLTNNKGVDIILDSFGSTIGNSIDLAGYNSRIISFGVLTGIESTLNVKKLYLKNISIIGTHNASKIDFDESFDFASKNNIHPIIGSFFNIKEISKAHQAFEKHEFFGKIVIKNRF
ncbi:MAG: alcohol dehydrogenase catalytic domain-containing protein [Candidatus Micrarchaeaceae archaeon]